MRDKIFLKESITTAEIMFILKKEKYLFVLDSSKENDIQSKYTYIGVNPVDYLILNQENRNKLEILEKLNSFYNKYKKTTTQGVEAEKFYTGFLSFFSYDLGLIFMDIKKREKKEISKVPYGFIGYYPVIIRLEGQGNDVILYYDDQYEEKALKLAKKIADGYNGKIKVDNNEFILSYKEALPEYKDKIEKIKDYIYEGDIYQVNYTRQFIGRIKDLDSLSLYMSLRIKNPAPFSAFISGYNWQILSTSPEKLVKNVDGKLTTRPIKGTIAVDKDKLQNEKNKELLLNSVKDKSELLMIVDLERSDLSKIAISGTVKVEELYKLETYKTVHHLVSTVSCIKKREFTPIDILYNIFPGGSITGTPKKRAMEIIEELENFDRGIYTGSIGYIDHNGNFDFSIAIRTVIVESEEVKFNVGGGITWKSEDIDEFKETEAKGLGIMKGLGLGYNN